MNAHSSRMDTVIEDAGGEKRKRGLLEPTGDVPVNPFYTSPEQESASLL